MPSTEELYSYLIKLQTLRKQIVDEASKLEWQARIMRSKTCGVDDEIQRIVSILSPSSTAMIKYDKNIEDRTSL